MASKIGTLIPHQHRDVRWRAFASLGRAEDVVAAVSTRHGGVSGESLGSLNLSYAVGDDHWCVRENRRRFSEALGIEEAMVVCAEQVHGSRIAYVSEENAGAGYERRETAIPDVDGLISDRPGLALWLGFADCVPILAHDPVRRAVGVAHAGWRGTLARVAEELVRSMAERLGSRPADLRVAIGPSIGPCCYTVGPEVITSFERTWATIDGLFSAPAGETRRLNLWEANRRLLVGTGVPRDRIAVASCCTSCHVDEFFSHRAQGGRAGRIAAVIGLRNGG